MANLKTSELTPASALTGDELLPLVQGAGNVSATLDQVIGLLSTADLADFTSGAATSGQVPTADGAGGVAWDDVTAGDVVGPASATDNAIARFDGITGKLLKNSVVTIDDIGVVTINGTAVGNAAKTLMVFGDSTYTQFIVGRSVLAAIEFTWVQEGIPYGRVGTASNAAPVVITGSYFGVGSINTPLVQDTAGALARRNGTTAQTNRLYSTYTSATSYHRMALTCAKQTLSAVSGATVATTGGLIPAGAFLMGVTTRINTALGTSNGTTGYSVGNGTDANLWGDVTAVAAGTASKASAITDQSSGYTASDACGLYLAAQDVTLTAVGGNFDATGAIEISAFYFLAEAD